MVWINKSRNMQECQCAFVCGERVYDVAYCVFDESNSEWSWKFSPVMEDAMRMATRIVLRTRLRWTETSSSWCRVFLVLDWKRHVVKEWKSKCSLIAHSSLRVSFQHLFSSFLSWWLFGPFLWIFWAFWGTSCFARYKTRNCLSNLLSLGIPESSKSLG